MNSGFFMSEMARLHAATHGNAPDEALTVLYLAPDFFVAYAELALEGKCDGPLGAECRRVWDEYISAVMAETLTESVREFIVRRANAWIGE